MSKYTIGRAAIAAALFASTYREAATENDNTGGAPATDIAAAEAAKTAVVANIKANFNNKVDVKDVKFHFRKVKDETTGLESKRPTVELPIPAPSVEGIIDILQAGGKPLELLLAAVEDVVIEQARAYINDNEEVNAENFPYNILGWEYIANLPKAERRGGGISKEVWEDFAKDYIEVMPGATGKKKEQCELATKIFLNKFATVKTDKKVLNLLKQQLAIYINASPNAESFAECVEALDKKATTLLEADTSNVLEAL